VAFLILSGALALLIHRAASKVSRYFLILCLTFILLSTAVITFEFFAGIDPGLEETVFRIHGELNGVPIGRMSPIAAVNFFFTSGALLVITISPETNRALRQAAVLISLIVMLVGVITAIGYLFGTPILYGGLTRPVAPTAAVGFICLNIGLITTVGTGYWPAGTITGSSVQAQLLRSFLPVIVGILFFDGWVNANIPDEMLINQALLSSISMFIFISLSVAIIFRQSRKIGGAIDRAESKRKVAEAKTQELVIELKRSNEELQQFAYVASHDLQEPLRMVTSYMQLLQRRYHDKLDDDANEFIGFAVDGATRMRQMIIDLLTLSRVGTRGGDFVPVKSEAILDEVIDSLQVVIAENGARVTHDPLPEIVADPHQLGQILQNLIANAIKFRGEEPPRIHVSAQTMDDDWLFSVTDNGIGIEPAYQKRIFVIFQRIHGRSQYEGSGIGLAVCKRIAERHGGTIWVDSRTGAGSTFYFSIAKVKGGNMSAI
jgi:signal transduction histidine kinase